jgi:hypothetical protein
MKNQDKIDITQYPKNFRSIHDGLLRKLPELYTTFNIYFQKP